MKILRVYASSLIFGLFAAGAMLPLGPGTASSQLSAPNFIFIFTDDQRWDTVCAGPNGIESLCSLPSDGHAMPTVEAELVAKGTAFTNAFVTNPLCCPSRAALLSGGFYPHHTNVLSNGLPNGGFQQFIDTQTLPTLLQQGGYKTALIGKYLNSYDDTIINNQGYVPPGWDLWLANGKVRNWLNDYDFVEGTSGPFASSTGTKITINDGTYFTDYERDRALAFIDDTCTYQSCDQPFFLFLAFGAPHLPATPAPRHTSLFADFLYRDRSYDELPDQDLTDKPLSIQNDASKFNAALQDSNNIKQLRSLRAVDEAVGALIANLEAKDILNNTVIIYTSDNGFMWGEHKQIAKFKAYEESIRVPFVMRIPDTAASSIDKLVDVNLDVPPTIAELAGLAPMPGDGRSLVALVQDPGTAWRTSLLVAGGVQGSISPWRGIRTDNWKYVEYASGEKELYDLTADPFELTSLHANSAYQAQMADLAAQLAALKPGVWIRTSNMPDILSDALPAASVGQPYTFQFLAQGGNGEHVFTVDTSAFPCTNPLPAGLTLSTAGLLSGTPTAAQSASFCVKLSDTTDSPQPGNDRPQSFVGTYSLRVNAVTTGTLEGTITDSVNGSPLEAAVVTVGSFSTASNVDGFYQLAGVPGGTFTVTAGLSGYITTTIPNVAVTAGQTTTQNIALAPVSCLSNCLRSASITGRAATSSVTARVTVVNETGATVSGASVSAHWILPDGSTQTSVVATNTRGLARFTLTASLTGIYTFTIDSISLTGYTFDAAGSVLSVNITK